MNHDNNNPHERHIDTVLAALRQAEPAPGMEQRITAALLREAAAAPSRWAWLTGLPQVAGVAAVLAVALSVLSVLSVYVYRLHSSLQERPMASTQQQGRQQHSVEQPPSMHATAPSAVVARHGANVPRASSPNHVPGVQTGSPGADVRTQSAGQLQAQQSFPAPPLPLTDQERLLVQLVHRDDPVQLAQLTPAAREAELQRDREQVREFFKPPPMLAANFTLEPYPTPGGTQ